MLKMSYIASAFVSAYRITKLYKKSQYYEILDKLWQTIPNNVFEIGVLYNALTEKNMSNHPYLEELFKRGMKHIHADSGGLQAVTLNKEISYELKKSVYETQSNYSTYAMCFDELPVVKSDNDSIVNPERYFNPKILVDCATKTGHNINEQIEIFKSNPNNKSKVFLILQGNCSETFTEWANVIWDIIKDENKDLICGVALAPACIGSTNYNMLVMINGLIKSKIPKKYYKNIHLLGIGSAEKIITAYHLLSSPLFDFVEELTFDSTTHTKSTIFGKYSTATKQACYNNKQLDADFILFLKQMYVEYEKLATGELVRTEQEFIDEYTNSMFVSNNNRTLEEKDVVAFYRSLHIIFSIINFSLFLENIINERISGKPYYIYNKLRQINSIEEFDNMLKVCYNDKNFDTRTIPIFKEINSIEDFI